MFSYSPQKTRSFSRFKVSLPIIVFCVALLIGGMLVIKAITKSIDAHNQKKVAGREDIIYPAYKEHVAKETDMKRLVETGNSFLKSKQYNYAALKFKRASDLDANFRDSAYAWAYSVIKTDSAQLTQQDLHDLHSAFDRIEKVDPLYEPYLKLKSIVSDIEHNDADKKIADDRLAALEIKN